MTVLDDACTWIGRIWALCFLLLVLLIAACAVADAARDRQRRKVDVRRARATAAPDPVLAALDLSLWELELPPSQEEQR